MTLLWLLITIIASFASSYIWGFYNLKTMFLFGLWIGSLIYARLYKTEEQNLIKRYHSTHNPYLDK